MLHIKIPETELWDEKKEEFVYRKEQTIQMECSLIAISKWESKWCKSFFSKKEKTYEEVLDFIKCMTLNKNLNDETFYCLTENNLKEINKYIEAPMTAITFFDTNDNKSINRDTITSELIYYWMIAFNIPFECQKWHINRLLTLIRVCEIKNRPPKKMSNNQIISRNKELNSIRRKKLNTKG